MLLLSINYLGSGENYKEKERVLKFLSFNVCIQLYSVCSNGVHLTFGLNAFENIKSIEKKSLGTALFHFLFEYICFKKGNWF